MSDNNNDIDDVPRELRNYLNYEPGSKWATPEGKSSRKERARKKLYSPESPLDSKQPPEEEEEELPPLLDWKHKKKKGKPPAPIAGDDPLAASFNANLSRPTKATAAIAARKKEDQRTLFPTQESMPKRKKGAIRQTRESRRSARQEPRQKQILLAASQIHQARVLPRRSGKRSS